jgi:hypothetical protein
MADTAQEHVEHIEHASKNKRVAVLIAGLAALLAITESSGKSAQNESMIANIEASDTWAFYQAKTIRMTTANAIADAIETSTAGNAAAQPKVDFWRGEAKRLDTDPKGNEGRKELALKAQKSEAKRELSLAAYHNFEFGSAALQIAIVLASAGVITGVVLLIAGAAALGAVGAGLCALGWFAPTLLHF